MVSCIYPVGVSQPDGKEIGTWRTNGKGLCNDYMVDEFMGKKVVAYKLRG